MFFYYQKTVTSRWSPMKSADEPPKKGPEGYQNRPMTRVIELPPHQHDFPLEQLSKIYPSSDL